MAKAVLGSSILVIAMHTHVCKNLLRVQQLRRRLQEPSLASCVHHGADLCRASAPEPQRDLPVPVVLQEIVLRILQAAAVEQGEAPSPQPWAGCSQAELCVPSSGHPWGAEGPTGS